MVECGVIGVIGGVLGALLASVSLRLIGASIPARIVAEGVLVVDGYADKDETALTLNPAQCIGCDRCERTCPEGVLRLSPAMGPINRSGPANGPGR